MALAPKKKVLLPPPGYGGRGWNYAGNTYSTAAAAARNALPGGGVGGGAGGGASADPYARLTTQVQGLINQYKHPNYATDPSLLAWKNEKDALARDTAAEQVRIDKEANRAGNYALALTRLNQADVGDVAQQYRNAAAQITGLGTGLTGTVQADQQQAAAQTAAAVNAVTGGRAPVGGIAGFNPAELRNASQLTGVTIPATSFAEESARAASEAAMRNKEAGWNILGISEQYRQKAIDARLKAHDEMAKLLSTRPELVAKVAQQYQTNREGAVKILAQIVNQRETAKAHAASTKAYTDWLVTQGTAKTAGVTGVSPTGGPTPELTKIQNDYNVKIAKAKGDARKQQQATIDAHQKLAYYHTNANHYISDWRGRPIDQQGNLIPAGQPVIPQPGYKLDAQGNVVKQYAPSTTAAGKLKPPSYTDFTKIQSTMSSAGRTKFGLDNPFATKAQATAPIWTKKRISSWLMSQYGNVFLARYPGQRKTIQNMADQAAASLYADLLTRKRAALGG